MNPDLIERLQDERSELAEKICRLNAALANRAGISQRQRILLREQCTYMQGYERSLIERIEDLRAEQQTSCDYEGEKPMRS